MRQSRREFLDVLSGRTHGMGCRRQGVAGGARPRGLPGSGGAGRGGATRPELPPGVKAIRISSNENPLGPGKAALDAIVGKFPEAGRYPFNSTPADSALVRRDRGEVQRQARERRPRRRLAGDPEERRARVHLAGRGLVTASPSFENCPAFARKLGHPVVEVKVDAALRLDLDAMAAAAKGAGLVFLNNPNNPTATVHGAQGRRGFRRARARARRPTRSS